MYVCMCVCVCVFVCMNIWYKRMRVDVSFVVCAVSHVIII